MVAYADGRACTPLGSAPRHGHPQRDAGFVLRRGRYLRRRPPSRTGWTMVAEGADIVDVGGESSRPGAEPVPEAVELARVIPVIEALCPPGAGLDRHGEAGRGRGGAPGRCRGGQRRLLVAVGGGGRRGGRMGGRPHAGLPGHHAGRAALRRRGGRGLRLRAGPGARGPGGPGSPRCGSIRASASARRRRTTSRCSITSPSWWRRPRHRMRRRAGGHQSQAVPRPAGGSARERRAAGVEERVEGSLATAALAMVAGVSMVRVHDVAVTVQAARLYGPAA